MEERKIATNDQEYGYFESGEPSSAQMQFQDTVDNAIFDLLQNLKNEYEMVMGKITDDIEWDIGIITQIREEVQDLLGLPDIY